MRDSISQALPVIGGFAAALRFAAVAVGLPACVFLYRLGAYPLSDTNEGLYAEIAREMTASGHLVVPQLLGVPYIEKPPLWYWTTAAWFDLFGPSAWTARLTSALSMTLLAAGLAYFLKAAGHRLAGMLAAMLVAACWPAGILARTAFLDPLFIAAFSGAMLLFATWRLSGRLAALAAGAVLLALATLTKGLVAPLLATGSLCLFRLTCGRQEPPWSRRWLWAAGLFLAVALPWHLAAWLMQEDFGWFYFINEHVLRFLGMRQPFDYHVGPPYYYLPLLLGILLPWTPLLGLLVRNSGPVDRDTRLLIRYCQCWAAFPILFYSASVAKAHYYLFVVAPPLLIWLALSLVSAMRRRDEGVLAAACAGVAACCAAAVHALWHTEISRWSSVAGRVVIVQSVLLGCAVFLAALPALRALLRSPRRQVAAPVLAAAFGLPVLLLAQPVLLQHGVRDSSRQLAQALHEKSSPSMQVFLYRDYEDVFGALPFYLGRRVGVIDSQSEDLKFGCAHAGEASACLPADRLSCGPGEAVAVAVAEGRIDEFLRRFGACHWSALRFRDKWLFMHTLNPAPNAP